MQPGLRLRLAREKLGLTYRDVERASYELAVVRGRSDFILHISRLADIENLCRVSARLRGLSRVRMGRGTRLVENLQESPKIREKEFLEIIGGVFGQEDAVRFQLPPV